MPEIIVRKYGPVVFGILIVVFFSVYSFKSAFPESATRTLYVGVGKVPVEAHIADTPALRTKGLSNVAQLKLNEGVFFVFPEDGYYSFWMKDMNFAIDILWISKEKKIVYQLQSITPETYPHSFTSPTQARYVLEVPAGFVERHNILVGDAVLF